MESALTTTRTRALRANWQVDPGSVCAWLLPVALVTYLGVRSGGYDPVVSDQVAIALWWVVFLILASRIAPIRLTAPARVGFVLLTGYAAWTTLSLTWTESSERTMGDVTLMLLYVALALLAFLIRGREAARLMLNGLAVAITAVATIAVLSRLHFAWFAVPEVVQNLPGSAHRLSYPLGYWNALAALVAIGIPLALYAATGARTLVCRAVAAASVPLLALCVYLTASRGGVVEVALGVLLFLALAPDRLPKLVLTLMCAAGSALLIGAADQRSAVRDGLRTPLAAHQGDQLIAVSIAVMLGVALLAYAIALIERHFERPRWLTVTRRRATTATLVAAIVALALFAAAGGPGFLSREWSQFKTAAAPANISGGTTLQRLQNVTGEGRYQYWQASGRAAKLDPLAGTGAATFVYWWARDGTAIGGFVQDAHSLYLQALGELGYPGLLLIGAFVAWILLCGLWGVIRVRDPDRRLAIAAATAGAGVFAFTAALEWIWLIPVLPVSLLILAAVIFAPTYDDHAGLAAGVIVAEAIRRAASHAWVRAGARVAGGLTALAALAVIALPLSATAAVRSSQQEARAGNLAGALGSARQAVRLQPYAASSWLQEALVLEVAGDLPSALAAAKRATANESTNSNNWLVLSRLEARTGNASAAVADYLRARSLNPHSPVFSR